MPPNPPAGPASAVDDRDDKVPPPADASEGGHREHDLEVSFDTIVAGGRARLHRPWPDLLITGTVGGIEVAFGVLALLYVDMATGDTLLGSLAFSIGFIALLLGNSELFTEGFLVPVTLVAAGEARLRDLLRLWMGTLAGNLAGGLAMAGLVDEAYPDLHREAVKVAAGYVGASLDGRTFCLAVLAGGAISLLTRMHNGTDQIGAKLVASVAIAFLLSGIKLDHSVLDSLLAFFALLTGHASFGWVHWLAWFGFVVVGNVSGGLILTTLLRLARSRHRLADYRVANQRAVPAREADKRSAPAEPGAGTRRR